MTASRTNWARVVRLGLPALLLLLITAFVLVRPRPAAPPRTPPRPLEGRTELVQGLSRETPLESVENLPHFDDTVWALGSMNVGTVTVPGSYEYTRVYVPRLNRVRKIAAQAGGQRREVIDRLRQMLLETSKDYPPVYDAFRQKVADTRGGVTLGEPDEYYRRTTVAPAAVYLLTELDAFDSLPVMSRVYATPGRLPVSRLFLLYSMHLLAREHPREGLAPAAAAALDAYRAAAQLPRAERYPVPAWDAPFEESDFRNLLFRQDLGFKDQPTVRLRLYPPLDALEDFDGTPKPEVQALFDKLRPFVDLAYPG